MFIRELSKQTQCLQSVDLPKINLEYVEIFLFQIYCETGERAGKWRQSEQLSAPCWDCQYWQTLQTLGVSKVLDVGLPAAAAVLCGSQYPLICFLTLQ